MPEVRYLPTMISGMPVVAAPAQIDITTAEQLRMVLLQSAARGHAAVVVDTRGPRTVTPHMDQELTRNITGLLRSSRHGRRY